jgi:hypothetical protein
MVMTPKRLRLDWRHRWTLREWSAEFWIIECTSQRCVGRKNAAGYLIPIEEITEAAIDDPRSQRFTLIPVQPDLHGVV